MCPDRCRRKGTGAIGVNEPSLRALVVDDAPAMRRLISRALCSVGFSCDVAADGIEAQCRLAADKYDVVVTDLCMPNQNGHTLVREMLERADRPVIVVLTAISDSRITIDLLARGVDEVLLKPIEYRSFASTLRLLIDRRTAAPPHRDVHRVRV
jgi:DNA-binding response OmpR family regulator